MDSRAYFKNQSNQESIGFGSGVGKNTAATPYNREETPNVQSPRQLKGISWVLVVISVLSSIFLFALDNTIVADVQPKIVATLGDIAKLPWISVAFSLGAVSVNLIWHNSPPRVF